MRKKDTIYIDFSDYGYHDFYPVDIYWMNFQFGIAEDWFEKSTNLDELHTDVCAAKLDLIVRSIGNEMDSNIMGHALLNMAMYGLLGMSVPKFYYTY
jgi:hypothetical protein